MRKALTGMKCSISVLLLTLVAPNAASNQIEKGWLPRLDVAGPSAQDDTTVSSSSDSMIPKVLTMHVNGTRVLRFPDGEIYLSHPGQFNYGKIKLYEGEAYPRWRKPKGWREEDDFDERPITADGYWRKGPEFEAPDPQDPRFKDAVDRCEDANKAVWWHIMEDGTNVHTFMGAREVHILPDGREFETRSKAMRAVECLPSKLRKDKEKLEAQRKAKRRRQILAFRPLAPKPHIEAYYAKHKGRSTRPTPHTKTSHAKHERWSTRIAEPTRPKPHSKTSHAKHERWSTKSGWPETAMKTNRTKREPAPALVSMDKLRRIRQKKDYKFTETSADDVHIPSMLLETCLLLVSFLASGSVTFAVVRLLSRSFEATDASEERMLAMERLLTV
eukprot:gnl/TRDRNA2_/TRDRNA2_38824_c0_seq1.p1 gnl/TRDRNA2_/TRDRNA2_38824_c0~~gnl/TRDRNA2_/TRDRNA2_38824_c0_seq1.p1  ORF type:complete len:388 (-),score=54.21 gnl/TRDRNA2_/TRDRNA2_38824_c0_seq1:9-1172(-)